MGATKKRSSCSDIKNKRGSRTDYRQTNNLMYVEVCNYKSTKSSERRKGFRSSTSCQVLKLSFTHMEVDMLIVLNFELFIVKWRRNIRWALANVTIKNSKENLHSISISLTLRETETMQSPGWHPKIGLKSTQCRWLPQQAPQANNPHSIYHILNIGIQFLLANSIESLLKYLRQ